MTRPFVCLMFHEVLPTEPASGSEAFFAVSFRAFRLHLDAISASGFAGCSIRAALAGSERPHVAISFDDGTAGHFDTFRELDARGMTATFFVTTSWVGRPGYLTWEQLRVMQAAGMEIGSHTRTHPFLSELGREALWDELANSRIEIDRELNQVTQAMAFPGGDGPRQSLRGILREAGYTTIATSRWGMNRPTQSDIPRFIRRCTVHGRVAQADFLRIIHGDRGLAIRRASREHLLSWARRILGPSRYARLRRRVLDRDG